jgi:phosphate transport system ATP-binding protein
MDSSENTARATIKVPGRFTTLGAAAREGEPKNAEHAAAMTVRHLSVYFGSNQAVKDISLDVPERAVTAIIGPSGCGKSTFLRALNRMHELVPHARVTGEIRLFGEDIYASHIEPVVVRRRVGMVFQKSNPFPTMSIADNVTVGLRLNGVRNSRVLQERTTSSLQMAALWDEVKDRLHEPAISLSGGQQQRLCIARCIAVNPEVILMDEPCSALDPRSTARVEELILELQQQYTIIIVTHNMQQASRVSDVTAFFYEGSLIEMDETETMFTRPSIKHTEDYITGRFG